MSPVLRATATGASVRSLITMSPTTMPTPPALVLLVHGTRSPVGTETTHRLADAVAAQRLDHTLRLGFLDVHGPSLTEVLDDLAGPAVVVPAVLSTGYHVRVDIPAMTYGRPQVRLARHLGPHPLLTTALVDRLEQARERSGQARGRRDTDRRVVLLATGSSDPAAIGEIEAAADDLATTLGVPVTARTLEDHVPGELLAGVEVSCYLLAEGTFATRARESAIKGGAALVTDPLGVLPEIVELIWQRYDAALKQSDSALDKG
jgi:sirohydrochlorin ferrochelatase